MNSRRRLYIIAFAVYTTALLTTTALAWLALQYNTAAGIAQLAVALSGNGLGGFALVLGILRDDRAEKERERARKAEESAKKSDQIAAEARERAAQFKAEAEVQRQRAERAEAERRQLEAERRQLEAELLRSYVERDRAMADRVSRLEAALGLAPPADSDVENNDATEK